MRAGWRGVCSGCRLRGGGDEDLGDWRGVLIRSEADVPLWDGMGWDEKGVL